MKDHLEYLGPGFTWDLGLVLYGSPFEPKVFHCLLLANEIILLTGNSIACESSRAASSFIGLYLWHKVLSGTEVVFYHNSSRLYFCRLSFFIIPFAHQFYLVFSNEDGDDDGDVFKQKSLITVP